MIVESRPGNTLIRDDDPITLASSLTDTDDNVSYILDDDGLKAEFGDDWELVKTICTKFCESVHQHRMNSHSDTDYIKFFDTMHTLAVAECLNSVSQERAIYILGRIFQGSMSRDNTLERLIKVLYGGQSKSKRMIARVD